MGVLKIHFIHSQHDPHISRETFKKCSNSGEAFIQCKMKEHFFFHSFFYNPPDNIYHTLFIFNLLQRQFCGKQCEKNQYSIKVKTRRESAEEYVTLKQV